MLDLLNVNWMKGDYKVVLQFMVVFFHLYKKNVKTKCKMSLAHLFNNGSNKRFSKQ